MLLECMMNSRGAQTESARANIEHAHVLLERAREALREAIRRAEEAKKSGGFWGSISRAFGGDIASLAGLVAAAAVTVGTGGAGAPAVIAFAAAGLTLTSKVGQELGLDPRLTAALGATGALIGLFAGNAASASHTWTTVAQVANGVQAAGSATGGAASAVAGHFESEAAHELANAEEQRGHQEDAWMRIDIAIDIIDRACRDISNGVERASDVVRNDNAGRDAVLARMGAA
jgi:hypothetical protein